MQTYTVQHVIKHLNIKDHPLLVIRKSDFEIIAKTYKRFGGYSNLMDAYYGLPHKTVASWR